MKFSLLELIIINLPMIVGGIIHMVLIKLPILTPLLRPVDNGMCWSDGKRLFGDNKTWKGFVSMPVGTALAFVVLELLTESSAAIQDLCMVDFQPDGILASGWGVGLFLGLAYCLAELPNSFIKRRLEIPPGQNVSGAKGLFFMVIDQIDSSVGCALALLVVTEATLLDVAVVAALGGFFHYAFAVLLFYVGLKKQRG